MKMVKSASSKPSSSVEGSSVKTGVFIILLLCFVCISSVLQYGYENIKHDNLKNCKEPIIMGAVYWVGQDGNVYLKGAQGVQNYGSASNYNVTDQGLTTAGANTTGNPMATGLAQGAGVLLASPIADPNAPATNNKAPGDGSGKTLNTAAVQNTQTTIDQLPGILQAALASEAQNHANTNATFDQQEGTQRGQYDSGTVTNQQNYDSNFMDSIRAGIKGLGGLMQILRGSGAAGGTADNQVQDTVGGITSDDIRTGRDTHDQNQGQLDSSLASFLTDLKGKRQANEDTFTNNNAAIHRDNATQMQDLYSKMAGFYGDAGQTAPANDWMARAGSLTPEIAQNTKTVTSPYDTAPVVIHAPNLTSFAAPTQPDVAVAPQDGQVGSGIFTMNTNNKRKDTSTTPVAVAQGA